MIQAEKQRKKFQSRILFILAPGKKIPKKIAKKKKPLSGIIFSQNGMRQARKREKKFSPEFRSYSTRGRKFRKRQQKNSKIRKTSFRHYCQPKRDKIGREIEKKILVPNSVHSRPGKENSDKNINIIQKIKTPLPEIIFSQNGMRQAEKQRKKFQSRILFILDSGKKITKKKQQKNLKKLKNLFQPLFIA